MPCKALVPDTALSLWYAWSCTDMAVKFESQPFDFVVTFVSIASDLLLANNSNDQTAECQ